MNQSIYNELVDKLIIRLKEGEYSDMEFLVETIEKYKIKVDEILEELNTDFGKIRCVDFNHLIYIEPSEQSQPYGSLLKVERFGIFQVYFSDD